MLLFCVRSYKKYGLLAPANQNDGATDLKWYVAPDTAKRRDYGV